MSPSPPTFLGVPMFTGISNTRSASSTTPSSWEEPPVSTMPEAMTSSYPPRCSSPLISVNSSS